jgi:para-nitrobenzyl esterase
VITGKRAIVALLALTALAASGCSAETSGTSPSPELTVTTTSGTLHGLATPAAREFLGVRYALAPTGPLRWTDPQPEPAASAVVQATKAGASCEQSSGMGAAPTEKETSEDCLFLNVTTPKDAVPGQRLPVMVWWHGGGYTTGSGADYDAQRLASQGHVVVVTVNYRLGVFGYFGLAGLPGSGDFGFADQIAATKWAKDNAAAFGGDPGNLTVFGESAGGMSACALLTSSQAVGLVQRVAISSGSCLLNWPVGTFFAGAPEQAPYTSLAADLAQGEQTSATLGCTGPDRLGCLRAKPAKDLLAVPAAAFSANLTYGTPLLPANPADAVRGGHVARIPVLSGGNSAEARAFQGGIAAANPAAITAATYPALAATAFGASASRVVAEYPLSRYPTPVQAWSTVTTDAAWSCPTLAGNQALAAATTVYPYEFAEPDPPNVTRVTVPGMAPGAAHTTDLPYLFDLGGQSLLTGADQSRLAAQMVALWTSFARTGEPVAPGVPPAVVGSPSSTTALSLVAAGSRAADVSVEHHCAFWSALDH